MDYDNDNVKDNNGITIAMTVITFSNILWYGLVDSSDVNLARSIIEPVPVSFKAVSHNQPVIAWINQPFTLIL